MSLTPSEYEQVQQGLHSAAVHLRGARQALEGLAFQGEPGAAANIPALEKVGEDLRFIGSMVDFLNDGEPEPR